MIDRVGAIDPNDRYPDAATMRQAHRRRGRRVAAARAARCSRAWSTTPIRTRRAPRADRTAPLFDQDAAEVVPRARPTTRRDEATREPRRARRRVPGERRLVPWIVAIVLIVTVGLAAAALAQVSSAKTVSVPGLAGLTIAQATQHAKAAGLDVAVGTTRAAPDPKGTVIDAEPGGRRVHGSATGDARRRRPARPTSTVPSIINAPWAGGEEGARRGRA